MSLSDKMHATKTSHKLFGKSTKESMMRIDDNISDVRKSILELKEYINKKKKRVYGYQQKGKEPLNERIIWTVQIIPLLEEINKIFGPKLTIGTIKDWNDGKLCSSQGCGKNCFEGFKEQFICGKSKKCFECEHAESDSPKLCSSQGVSSSKKASFFNEPAESDSPKIRWAKNSTKKVKVDFKESDSPPCGCKAGLICYNHCYVDNVDTSKEKNVLL